MANYTILLIDYEPRSVERIRLPLERAGFTVTVAKDGPTGIEQFTTAPPDAVIVEAMLPKKHGFEVCLELKQTPHGATIPVIVATSVYRGRKYRQQATHQFKADAFLEKPIADEDLLGAVNAGIDHYKGAGSPAAPAAPAEAPQAAPEATPATEPQPEPQAAAQPPKDDFEFDIVDRLDALLTDDPSKNSPSGS